MDLDQDIIYHEKFAAAGFIAILSPITALLFIFLVYHLFVESAEPFLPMTAFFVIMLVFFAVLTVGFSSFSITMTGESISIGFKIHKHRIPLTRIIDCFPDEISAARYGGFGIRVAKIEGKKRLVYNTIGTPRVLLSLNEGRFPEFVFSTKSPDEVINVIRAQVGLTRDSPFRPQHRGPAF